MMSPSESAKVRAPGAARRLNTDSRVTYSMSMKRGSVKPHKLTKVTISVSDTVRLSVRNVAPTSCCSKVKPWGFSWPGPFVGGGRPAALVDGDPAVRGRRVGRRRLAPKIARLPGREDVDDADALESLLVLV